MAQYKQECSKIHLRVRKVPSHQGTSNTTSRTTQSTQCPLGTLGSNWHRSYQGVTRVRGIQCHISSSRQVHKTTQTKPHTYESNIRRNGKDLPGQDLPTTWPAQMNHSGPRSPISLSVHEGIVLTTRNQGELHNSISPPDQWPVRTK